jgi:DNA-binding MarR family transcriptional regulator
VVAVETGPDPVRGRGTEGDAGLAAELRTSIGSLRRRLVVEHGRVNPLPIGAMAVLAALDRLGPRTVGELAVHEHVRPPTMTRIVNRLVTAGCVERSSHPRDGRITVVTVTEQGRRTLSEDRRQQDAWLFRRLSELDPSEREMLRRALSILDALSHGR